MTRFTVVSGVFLSLVLGAALSAVAQDEHPSERPPNAPQEPKETRPDQPQKPEQARPQDRQQEQQHPQQPAKPDDRRNQEPESGNRKNTTPQSEGRQPQDQQSGDRHMQGREHENEQQAGVKHEGQQRHISDTDFHAHFGREHHFAPRVLQPYQGKPSFAYGGYTFVLVEAWPSQWVYDDDDYYIDYIDGEYWMYNLLYPGARVELIIAE